MKWLARLWPFHCLWMAFCAARGAAPSITVMTLIAVSALTARRRRGCPRSAPLSSVRREVADKGSTPGGVRGGAFCAFASLLVGTKKVKTTSRCFISFRCLNSGNERGGRFAVKSKGSRSAAVYIEEPSAPLSRYLCSHYDRTISGAPQVASFVVILSH